MRSNFLFVSLVLVNCDQNPVPTATFLVQLLILSFYFQEKRRELVREDAETPSGSGAGAHPPGTGRAAGDRQAGAGPTHCHAGGAAVRGGRLRKSAVT